jgi:hypothetical protein
MKIAVFRDVAQTVATCGFFYPEDRGDTFLRNIGSHKIYTAPHPRKRQSSNFMKICQMVKMLLELTWHTHGNITNVCFLIRKIG